MHVCNTLSPSNCNQQEATTNMAGRGNCQVFVANRVVMAVAVALACTAAMLSAPASALSYGFYNSTCPNLENIVWQRMQYYLNQNITEAAGVLRLHFHDCFVQGCDGSVLLNATNGEQSAPPNLTLRPMALTIINDIKALVENACKGIVSCADILALAARDSVRGAGGPNYTIPLGRRDSLTFANRTTTVNNLPAPTFNVTGLNAVFAGKGFNITDLVSLSGGHTIGFAHCSSFSNRLFNGTTGARQRDPSMDQTFAGRLYLTCPTNTTVNTTVNDIRTPNAFDNKYYVNLLNRQTLFTSDQSLYNDSRTKSTVESFALDQNAFYTAFVSGMLKMGNLDVLEGSEGEIRTQCWTANSNSDSDSFSIIDSASGQSSEFGAQAM